MHRNHLVSLAVLLLVACSGPYTGQGELATAIRSVPCVEGAACTCGNLVQGAQTCRAQKSVCACPDGSETPIEPDDKAPEASDAGPDAPTKASAPAGDTCEAASLAKLRALELSRGGEILFAADLDGATDTFRSSCAQAEGPDLVQPIYVKSQGTLVVEVESTASFTGSPVIYAKATCADTQDLKCDPTGRRLEFPVVANRTYFLHVDGLQRAQSPGARVTLRAELR
jgi:hypothetical protein